MYTDFKHLFTVRTRNVSRIKVRLRLPPHLYPVILYLAKHTLLLISMLHFRMCNISKFTKNSLVVLILYLLIYLQQCFMTTLLRHIAFKCLCVMFSVLMVLSQTAIVLRYSAISAHIKPRKTIKTIKRENYP